MAKREHLERRYLASALILAMTFGAPRAVAEGTGTSNKDPWVVESRLDTPLQTLSLQLPRNELPAPAQFEFEMGFSTTEIPVPGVFHDSLSLSLSRGGVGDGMPLATLDAFGLTLQNQGLDQWIPGAVISAWQVTYAQPSLPGAVLTMAYAVRIQIPAVTPGQDFSATLDLFSNSQATLSRGYGYVVPEPGAVGLLLLGGLLVMCRKTRGRRS